MESEEEFDGLNMRDPTNIEKAKKRASELLLEMLGDCSDVDSITYQELVGLWIYDLPSLERLARISRETLEKHMDNNPAAKERIEKAIAIKVNENFSHMVFRSDDKLDVKAFVEENGILPKSNV